MEPTKTNHAVLRMPHTVLALLAYATAIVRSMANNPNFPEPSPRLVDVRKCIDGLRAACSPTLAPPVAVRERFRAELVAALQQLRAYVQAVAARDPPRAAAIIVSSGMSLRKTYVRNAVAFRARRGPERGSIVLSAPSAGKRAAYEWAYSCDGGDTWCNAPSTLQSKTCVPGFVPMSVVQFRYRPLTKEGAGEWSGVIAILVT